MDSPRSLARRTIDIEELELWQPGWPTRESKGRARGQAQASPKKPIDKNVFVETYLYCWPLFNPRFIAAVPHAVFLFSAPIGTPQTHFQKRFCDFVFWIVQTLNPQNP